MPPYNNQMYQGGMTPPGGMPQGPMGGIDPQMLQRYLQSQQQAPYGQQPPMQNMNPDQGMQQMPPQAPPGWGGMGMGVQSQLPPGVAETMRGMGMGQPGGMPMPKPDLGMGIGPNGKPNVPRPDWGPGGIQGYSDRHPMYNGGQGGGSPPFMPPGVQGKPMQMPPQAQQPPAPRLPPNAGTYRNPATGAMMNEIKPFSGQINPHTMDKPVTPQTGGVMTMPAAPVGPASDVSPVKAPPPNKPRITGSPPFNPDPNTRMGQATPPQEPGSTTGGQGFSAGDQKVNNQKLKAAAATRKFTSSSTR